jgi:hypothetical protein
MSFFKARTSAPIIATQVCVNRLEEHPDEWNSCKSSYSARHPMLAARLTAKSIRKRDHLVDYKEVNPFARAEADVTNDDIVRTTAKLESLKVAKKMKVTKLVSIDEEKEAIIPEPAPPSKRASLGTVGGCKIEARHLMYERLY